MNRINIHPGNENFSKPVVIVTGASSGIGRATTVFLAEKGWHVFATSRKIGRLKDLGSAKIDNIVPLQLDVTKEESRISAVNEVLAQTKRIDALVNNAGYSEIGPLEKASIEETYCQFETCTFGPLRMAQLVLPTMRKQGRGRIINVSTIGGKVSIPFLGLYNASKFALESMSDVLRMESEPFGIKVIVVEPGAVESNFNNIAALRAQRFNNDSESPYFPYYKGFNEFVNKSTAKGSPPEIVAKVIYSALTLKRPRSRYAATPDARIMLKIMPMLPDRVKDAIWRRMIKL
ncbi:MAG: SDR family oxidoreductase [Actinobacteria bacterium]|nr:SDR family oxidoreductase [Actinomycetota bacterium]